VNLFPLQSRSTLSRLCADDADQGRLLLVFFNPQLDMQFIQTPLNDDANFAQGYWQTPCGKWRLGLRRMFAGVRVSVVRDDGCVIDYCCGADHLLVLQVLTLLITALHNFSEDISPDELRPLFPAGSYKPIDRDPAFAILHERAGFPRPAYRRCLLETCDRVTYLPDADVCPSCGSGLSAPH